MKPRESASAQPHPENEESSQSSAPNAAGEAQHHAAPEVTLSADEYRQWVHERVARGVIVKLGGFLGAIGFGGLLALFAALASLGQNEIQGQVRKEIKSNWRISPKTSIGKFKWKSPTRC